MFRVRISEDVKGRKLRVDARRCQLSTGCRLKPIVSDLREQLNN